MLIHWKKKKKVFQIKGPESEIYLGYKIAISKILLQVDKLNHLTSNWCHKPYLMSKLKLHISNHVLIMTGVVILIQVDSLCFYF